MGLQMATRSIWSCAPARGAGSRATSLFLAGLLVALTVGGCSATSTMGSPAATTTPTASPAPSPTPTSSGSRAIVLPTPEVRPSPEETLEQKVADYLDGTTPMPSLFAMYSGDTVKAPLNLVDPKNVLFNKPWVDGEFQAYFIGTVVDYDAQHNPHLVGILGLRDGTPEDPNNPARGRFVVEVNLGRIDVTDQANDRDVLNTQGGLIISAPLPGTISQSLPVAEMRLALKPYEGSAIVSDFYVMTGSEVQGPDSSIYGRSLAETRAQNSTTTKLLRALIASESGATRIVLSDSLNQFVLTQAPIANQFGNDVFDPTMPSIAFVRPYSAP